MWNHSDKELSNTLHLKEEWSTVFNVHRYRLFMMSVIMKDCDPKTKSSLDDVEKKTTSNPQSDNHVLLHNEVSSVHTNHPNARKKLRSHTCIQSSPISKTPAFREVNESSISSRLDTSSDTMTSPSTFEKSST